MFVPLALTLIVKNLKENPCGSFLARFLLGRGVISPISLRVPSGGWPPKLQGGGGGKLEISSKMSIRFVSLGLQPNDSDHLQESPRPPGPKSQNLSQKESFWGSAKKSPRKYPKS